MMYSSGFSSNNYINDIEVKNNRVIFGAKKRHKETCLKNKAVRKRRKKNKKTHRR